MDVVIKRCGGIHETDGYHFVVPRVHVFARATVEWTGVGRGWR